MRYVTDLRSGRPSVREADLALRGNDKMWKTWQRKNGHGLHEHSLEIQDGLAFGNKMRQFVFILRIQKVK